NSTFTDIPGQIGDSYTATNLTATTYYRAVVTSGVCTPVMTASIVINISPASVAGNITPASVDVCSGTNTTTLTLAGNTGAIQWQVSTDDTIFNNIGGETGQSYT